MRIAEFQAGPTSPPDPDRVRLTLLAESGLSGAAEARLPGRVQAVIARLSELREGLIGTDPFDTEALIDRLLTRAESRSGDVEATAASLVEIACRDLVGRDLGVPIYRLLGGAVRDRIPACAVGWMPADRTLEGVTRAAGGVASRGFRAMALEPFGPGTSPIEPGPSEFRAAVRLAEAVRAAVGPDVALRIDLNARLSPGAAARFIRALERIDSVSVADPVSPALLPLAVGVPVSSGHRLNLRDEFFPLLLRRGCDTIRLDLSRCGGLTEARKIASLAESQGVTVSLRNLSSADATAASHQLATTLTNLAFVETESNPSATPIIIDGFHPLPQGPGLGDLTSMAPANPC